MSEVDLMTAFNGGESKHEDAHKVLEPVPDSEVAQGAQGAQKAENVEETDLAPKGFDRKELKTYAHLKRFPIAESWIRIAHTVPAPHFMRDYLMGLAMSNSVRQYTVGADNYVDQSLYRLEERAPQVKTLRMRDIRDILISPLNDVYVAARETGTRTLAATNRFLAPISRPLVDPVFKPVNANMLKLLNDTYPNNPIHLEDLGVVPNELSYTVALVNGGIERTMPAVETAFKELSSLPGFASDRIARVYKENRRKRGDDGNSRVVMLIASLDTVRTLVEEGYDLVWDSEGLPDPHD